MTTEQAVARQADHENLIQELREIVRRYVDRDIRLEGDNHTWKHGTPWTTLTLHFDAKAVLAKVQS